MDLPIKRIEMRVPGHEMSRHSYSRFPGLLTHDQARPAHTDPMKPSPVPNSSASGPLPDGASPRDEHSRETAETVAGGKGMPVREPRHQNAQSGRRASPKDVSVESSLELPSDRDQAEDMTAAVPDPKIEQAASDVASGMKDTSKAPELDQAYKKLGKSQT